jgi:hypothetical protein
MVDFKGILQGGDVLIGFFFALHQFSLEGELLVFILARKDQESELCDVCFERFRAFFSWEDGKSAIIVNGDGIYLGLGAFVAEDLVLDVFAEED